jgi:putative membrane protein
MSKQHKNEESGTSWGRLWSILGVLLGLGILAASILMTDFSKIIQAIYKGGPKLLLLGLFYPIDLASRGYSWKFVYPHAREIRTRFFMMGMWFAQSINRLLPTATIGGVILRGRYLEKKGGDDADVLTSLVADKTVHGVATVVVLFFGLILVLTEPAGQEIIIILLCVALSLGVADYLFIRLQLSSKVSELLEKWSDKIDFLSNLTGRARETEKELDSIYENPGGFITAVAIRVGGDIALTAEVWVAAQIMHTPISIRDALTLRLVGFGIRSAAFFIWGGMGIQETIYALLSGLIGLSPASLIALSLVTRLREYVPAVPGIALWLGRGGLRSVSSERAEKQDGESGGET